MLNGKTILVTGATNGIGEVAALELAKLDAHVIVVSRSESKCAETVKKIIAESNNKHIEYIAGDLSSLAGIRHVAQQFLEKYKRLDVLLNNAGGIFTSRQLSTDGLEMTFALNHMSYFLLTHLLLNTLKATAKEYGEARVVSVSSGAHHAVGGVKFDDLQRKKSYSAFSVYGETKLMNILFTQELAKRLSGTTVTANVLHPGFVKTGFGQNTSGFLGNLFSSAFGLVQNMFALTPEQGAQTSIYLASSSDVKGVSGKYFDKKKVANTSVATKDNGSQEKLWQVSETLAGLQ
jgi:retinol dehydrogenase 12